MLQKDVLKQGKILIIDDEKTNVRFLEIVLQEAEYSQVHSTIDPRKALELFRSVQPDLVLTTDATTTTRHKALQEGAQDFLSKPLNEIEVLLRIENLLVTRFNNVLLETKVEKRTEDLHNAQLETLQRLVLAAEYRDDDTGLHTKRVGSNAGNIATELGLPQAQVDLIRRAAPLDDVGKIGISDLILLKPGKLTDAEFDTMKQHT